MEFHIETAGSMPGLTTKLVTIQQAIHAIDPSASLDMDLSGKTIRVSAAMDKTELLAVLDNAGFPVAPELIEQMPSTCCGGCGG